MKRLFLSLVQDNSKRLNFFCAIVCFGAALYLFQEKSVVGKGGVLIEADETPFIFWIYFGVVLFMALICSIALIVQIFKKTK